MSDVPVHQLDRSTGMDTYDCRSRAGVGLQRETGAGRKIIPCEMMWLNCRLTTKQEREGNGRQEVSGVREEGGREGADHCQESI